MTSSCVWTLGRGVFTPRSPVGTYTTLQSAQLRVGLAGSWTHEYHFQLRRCTWFFKAWSPQPLILLDLPSASPIDNILHEYVQYSPERGANHESAHVAIFPIPFCVIGRFTLGTITNFNLNFMTLVIKFSLKIWLHPYHPKHPDIEVWMFYEILSIKVVKSWFKMRKIPMWTVLIWSSCLRPLEGLCPTKTYILQLGLR
jgi:hypothetical protein